MTLLTSQHRIIKENADKKELSAYGSQDLTAQGFRQENIFDPYSYNWGLVPSYGTFEGLGAPSVAINPFEFTVRDWTPNLQQYFIDSTDHLNFVRVNADNSISLSIRGDIRTWGPHAAINGEQVTIRLERGFEGDPDADVRLFFRRDDMNNGDYFEHPDLNKTFNDGPFQVHTVSTPHGLTKHYFNGVDNELNKSTGGDWNWRGGNDSSYIEWKTARMIVDGSWRAWMGNSTGSSSNSDDDTAIRFREVGNDLQVELAFRNGAYIGSFPLFDKSSINFDKEITWQLQRKATETNILINGVVMATIAGAISGLDMRIDQVGYANSRSGTIRYQGFIWDIHNTGTTAGTDQYLNIDEGTGNTCASTGAYAGNWTIQNTAGWFSVRQSFTGSLLELFLGLSHWSMGTMTDFTTKTDLFVEDFLNSGRNIRVQNFDMNSYVDLGEGSVIEHIDDDIGLGPAFVMVDNSTTQTPTVAADFTEDDNKDFADWGGLWRILYRSETLAPAGGSNGFTAITWDRRWDDSIRSYLQLDGINQLIQAQSAFNPQDGTNYLEFDLLNYVRDADTKPIFGSTNAGSQTYIGITTLGNLEMFNTGGYAGGGECLLGLVSGNWNIKLEWQRGTIGTEHTNIIKTDLDTGIITRYDNTVPNHTGGSWGFNTIGYSANRGTYLDGIVANAKFTNGLGTHVFDLAINDSTGTIIENTVGADFLAVGTDNTNWVWLDPIWQGIVIESITATAPDTGIDLFLRSDDGDKMVNIPVFGSTFNDLAMGFDPRTGSFLVYINRAYSPELSGTTGFRTTDPKYCYDAALRTTCGENTTVGTVKHINLFQLIGFTDNGVVILDDDAFLQNKIIHSYGIRPLVIVPPANRNLRPYCIVEYESELPVILIIRRPDGSANVLIDQQPQVTHRNTNRGSIVSGNVPAVGGAYAAYFTNSVKTGVVTTFS
ncbi:MAG: hypothetical protein COA84_14270 [Robiginitomaculum sp.]|nr:MAG: hypothetical protein COA84_14270 [Robiginitomaculum sp.]